MSEEASSSTPERGKSWLPWIIAALAVAVAISIVIRLVLPGNAERERLNQDIARLQGELGATKQAAQEQQGKVDELLRDKDSLSQEQTLTKERLEAALSEKAQVLADLEKARQDLSKALGTQIAAGDVFIKSRSGELVVDVADKLLFDTGKAEVSDAGQKLLLDVAASMRRLPPTQIFQVGGHTDSQRVVSPELVEQFPTNWELSTTRATRVVRFLEDKGKVPGRQLVAAGFAQFRPASSNRTDSGRQKNRRIEIVLVRKAPQLEQ
ncbi:MAG TPA: flagellar motor protein MotB [Polyangiaceae bacterium]|jgi:chemotaxis protein MotB|nr:flagellar motor protein MotB [Polyangiaceae bacterium]